MDTARQAVDMIMNQETIGERGAVTYVHRDVPREAHHRDDECPASDA